MVFRFAIAAMELSDQLVVNVLIKGDCLAGTGAFHVFQEVDAELVRAAKGHGPEFAPRSLSAGQFPSEGLRRRM
jgi:hypothetical protein